MPHQRPKENQNRAFRSNFLHLEMTMNAWKINFLAFFSIFTNSLYPMDFETSINELGHQNTSLGAQGVPFFANKIRFYVCKWPKWKWHKTSLLGQFPCVLWLDMAIFRPKICSHLPQMILLVSPRGILMGKFVSTGFWVDKILRNGEKMRKN